MFFAGTALFALFLDQLSKAAVQRFLAEGESVTLIPRIFYLTYVRNPGAAFGLFAYQTAFFIAVTLTVIVLVLVMARQARENGRSLKLGMGMVLGGAAGNLIDRLRLGVVIDFLDFRIWPVFNLADAAIVLGALLLARELWKRGEGEKAPRSKQQA